MLSMDRMIVASLPSLYPLQLFEEDAIINLTCSKKVIEKCEGTADRKNWIPYCPTCNADLDADRGCFFCPNCGQKLEWEEYVYQCNSRFNNEK